MDIFTTVLNLIREEQRCFTKKVAIFSIAVTAALLIQDRQIKNLNKKLEELNKQKGE